MSTTRYGSLSSGRLERQPSSELLYSDNGLVEGQIIYALDSADWAYATALLGSAHEDDSNVWLYRLRRAKNNLGITLAIFDCIGVSKDPTDRIVSYPASVNTDPIETHPKFVSHLAGTGTAPLNGAKWLDDGEGGYTFEGFMNDDAPAELRGVRSYFTGAVVARATYFSRTPPAFRPICKIVTSLPNIPDIAGVKNWLYLPPSSEQIANVRLWRVSEEFLGSLPAGWSQKIYGP